MEWVDRIRGEIVGLDTAPLIYFIEEHPVYVDIVDPFFEAVDKGEVRIITSIVTLLEVLVHPFRRDDVALAQQYRDILLNVNNVTSLPLSQDIAERSARIRAQHAVRTPDAIQIATAIYAGASYFVTNDTRLPTLDGLEVITLDELIGDH